MTRILIAMILALGAGLTPALCAATRCITDVMVVGGENKSVTNSYAAQGWTVIKQDLNARAGGDYIYLLYKSASVESATNGIVTGFYIKTGNEGVTQTLTHKDRLYRLVPYDGGDHFKDQKGDLNSNAGGAAIHLYYTKLASPDGRAVTGIAFNSTQSGAVGADGGSEGYDLNDGCGGETDYIYMHVTTATVPYVSPVSVTDVVARQRWPWNGLVDIACTVSGIEWEPDGHDFAVAAVMDSSVYNATHLWVAKDGKKSFVWCVPTNGNYRLIWDARADLGPELYSNVVVRVTVVSGHARAQLWEGGPYWAMTNVGAEKPEDYGLYFWWGDTVGYRPSGTTFSFSFEPSNCPTYKKSESQLKEGGWLTDGGVLAPEHDAAQAHWGGAWRMPTKQELADLVNKCNWNETTLNGVDGYVVRGQGAYESASIFLPCAGYGNGTSFYNFGLFGYYWSSVPYSDYYNAWRLYFGSGGGRGTIDSRRFYGHSVRPVQGFTEALMVAAGVAHAGDSAKMVLDLRTERESGGDETLLFSSLWDGGEGATVTIAQDGVAIAENLAGEGEQTWSVPYNGTYELTHTTYANGVVGKAETATFVVTGKAEPPEITDVVATPSEPWDGTVSISFNVVNSPAAACPDWNQPYLSIVATDNTTGSNYVSVASALSGDTDAAGNGHAVTWDFKAQGLDFASPDVTFTVAYLKMPDWCVIDLSGGKDAAHYPVTYVSNVPNVPTVPNVPGGTFNTDAYKTTKLVMRLIEPGTFKMGGTTETEITNAFYCAIFETTQKQWELVTGNRPSHFKNDADSPMRPVEKVSWDRIRGDDFLGALRQKTGLDALDLPTEAQWEYACRAGTPTKYSYGDDVDGDYMWFGENSTNQTHAVGTKRPNAWDLYDMHGNVCEWCLDLYDPELSNRVERGGNWYFSADFCTSSSRSDILQSYGYHDLGFRLVRTLSNNLEGERSAEAVAGAERAGTVCAGASDPVALGLPSSSSAEFGSAAYSAAEGETLEFEVAVKGVNAAMPSRAAVYISYLTAAAADLDLKNGTVDGVTPKGGLKFPLTLTWDAGDTEPKAISIPVKTDKTVEGCESFVLQLAEFVGMEPGETDICMVTVKDPSFDALREKIEAGTATKAESNTWNKVNRDGVPYMCGLAYPADGGKVKGSGYCPAGKKVTLKATASKGWKFLGWRQGTGNGFVARTPSLAIDRTAKPAKVTKTSTTISKLTESATFYAVFEGVPLVSAIPVADDDGVGLVNYNAGKVTGEGRYAPGKKVTLKAAANKGYVFAGWAARSASGPYQGGGFVETALPDEVVSQAASLSFEMPSSDVAYVAMFVTADEDKRSVELAVDGTEMRLAGYGSPYRTNVWAGVYLEWPVAASALSETKVKVAGLPAGLKFTDKPVTSKVGKGKTAVVVTNVPANTIYGAPKAASKTDKNGNPAPSTVKVTVTTAGKSSVTYVIALTVDALPTWAVGNFHGAVSGGSQLAATETGAINCAPPVGTVSLTVSAAGKISGKMLEGGKTWTLSAGEFSRVERVEHVEDGLVFHAAVIGKSGKEEITNEVTVAAGVVRLAEDGSPHLVGVVSGETVGRAVSGEPLSWSAWQNLWKRADTKASQPVFKKNIEKVLELGAAGDANNTLKLTFKKDGVVAFAGKVGGASVSGSSQLVPRLAEDGSPDHGDGSPYQVTLYAPPKGTFKGYNETMAVTLTLDAQDVVTAVNVVDGSGTVQLGEGGQ